MAIAFLKNLFEAQKMQKMNLKLLQNRV